MFRLFVLVLSLFSTQARLIGDDPRTWSPVPITSPENLSKCEACKDLVNYIENYINTSETEIEDKIDTLCDGDEFCKAIAGESLKVAEKILKNPDLFCESISECPDKKWFIF
jgi:hypothetical protein